MLFTPLSFAVPNVRPAVWKLNRCGLIVDRLCMGIITAASGKNFITVNVVVLGGLGVAIAHRPHSRLILILRRILKIAVTRAQLASALIKLTRRFMLISLSINLVFLPVLTT